MPGVTVVTEPSTRPGASIHMRGVTHVFPAADESVVAVDDLDLSVPEGGYVALSGPSGAGKSTLLALIGGLEPLQHGSITVGGHDLANISSDALAAFRRETVGFVFQHYGLVPVLTALENVELALALAGIGRAARRGRATELLRAVGLWHRRDHRPDALSGGERQRVAIARAVANRPTLVLADEPTGNLDTDSAASVLELLGSLRADTGCTLVVVTHDASVANRAEARYRLDRGRWA
jgi:putative ABC transport system ATP-binding protein